MAVAAENSGTQTAVISTEHFVEDTPNTGVFTFHVDVNAMVDGDILELRIYQMVLTGGTARALAFASYYGAQPSDALIKVIGPAVNELTDGTSLRFSLKQTHGTGRAFPWKVLKVKA